MEYPRDSEGAAWPFLTHSFDDLGRWPRRLGSSPMRRKERAEAADGGWQRAAITVLLLALLGGCADGPRKLTAGDVTDVPPGTARGATFSGQYVIADGSVEDCECDRGACSTTMVKVGRRLVLLHNEGRLQATFDGLADLPFSGGVDADGAYRLGARAETAEKVLYARIKGRLHVSPGGQPTRMDATEEAFVETSVLLCNVRVAYHAEYQGP